MPHDSYGMGQHKEEDLARWRGLVSEQATSGKSVAAFCGERALLRSVPGVGPLTALTYVLTVADTARFASSREVGAFLGLRPRQRQSGSRNPELGIAKKGDHYLRSLLVECAHYVLSRAPDSALKRWGLGLAQSGPPAKRRALVAIARKLAVLLHSLWSNGELCCPFPAESPIAA